MSPKWARDPIMVQIRLPRELVRRVDHWAIDADLTRAQAFARLLERALPADRNRELS